MERPANSASLFDFLRIVEGVGVLGAVGVGVGDGTVGFGEGDICMVNIRNCSINCCCALS